MAKQKIKQSAKKSVNTNTKVRFLKITLLIILIFLINLYLILRILYNADSFTVSLDSENGRESGLVIYEDPSDKRYRTYLKCASIDFFTDISVDWLPENIDNEGNGSHNGRNYIAYTFYAENLGQETINYWSKIEIDDVIKNVDEAVRVMLYKNGERVIYAKPNKTTGQAESGTVTFKDDKVVMLQNNENFKVGDLDKYTIVIYVEGSDPDCIDDLIGGEIGMHMTLTEEHIPNPDEEQKSGIRKLLNF